MFRILCLGTLLYCRCRVVDPCFVVGSSPSQVIRGVPTYSEVGNDICDKEKVWKKTKKYNRIQIPSFFVVVRCCCSCFSDSEGGVMMAFWLGLTVSRYRNPGLSLHALFSCYFFLLSTCSSHSICLFFILPTRNFCTTQAFPFFFFFFLAQTYSSCSM